jgi:hypothetical protein
MASWLSELWNSEDYGRQKELDKVMKRKICLQKKYK